MLHPWVNERIYPPYKLAALVEVLSERGIGEEKVLDGTGVRLDHLTDPDARTSISQYVTACRNTVRLQSDPAVPFEIGRKLHLSAYGMYGYAVLCSLSMRDFFETVIKYRRLATPAYSVEWQVDGSRAISRFIRPTIPLLEPELQAFLCTQQIVLSIVHGQDAWGIDYLPIGAAMPPEFERHADLYIELMRCPISWNAPIPEIYHDATILDKPAPLSHRLTSTMMRATCDSLLGQAKTSVGIAGKVYQVAMAQPGQIPTMAHVAESLHMTERTLRRKLEAEDTSFAEILDDMRLSLALECLKGTNMTTEHIAELIGYDNATNFRRAFKRWTGKTPREYRT